ncbi:MAG: DHHA1 domain-containing protein, partial [Tepidisphaeraceae bacterium]
QTLPQLAKRRSQAAVLELQQKLKQWEKSQKQQGAGLNASAVAEALFAGIRNGVIVAPVEGASDDELRSIIDSLKTRQPSLATLLASVQGDKVSFVAAVSEDLIKKGLKAGDWVKEAAKITGGGGGGRPNLAQAGGKDASKVDDALSAARAFAAKVVG